MARGASDRKVYAHAKLRRLRREHGMNQVDMARALGISTSYANQIEQSQRPLTASVLLRIAEVFGVDAEFFSAADEDRLAADLRAALADEACGVPLPAAAVQFPLRESSVRSVVVGGSRPVQVRLSAEWMGAPIPGACWNELDDLSLVRVTGAPPADDQPGPQAR